MISRRVENAGSFHLAAVYNYKIDGNRIYHTRTNVVIDCCAYSKTDQLTAIGTLTNNMLLPDVLEEAMVCGIVSMLVRDDAFMQQAQVYKSYFDQTLSWISQGLVSVPPKVVPGPTLTANAA
ncbi:MAG TPA: hypothetical protein VN256_13205 [Pyrinomonadaceae bacterium]|nr:hypothetical protein [Pyrinomonadaceae bacterium]